MTDNKLPLTYYNTREIRWFFKKGTSTEPPVLKELWKCRHSGPAKWIAVASEVEETTDTTSSQKMSLLPPHNIPDKCWYLLGTNCPKSAICSYNLQCSLSGIKPVVKDVDNHKIPRIPTKSMIDAASFVLDRTAGDTVESAIKAVWEAMYDKALSSK